MAGNRSKPIQLIVSEKRGHRTKTEIEHREKSEKSLYTGFDFKESPVVKSDPIAHKEFGRLKKLYKKIQYVDGLDEQTINRYCTLISQEAAQQHNIYMLNEQLGQCDDGLTKMQIVQAINAAFTRLEKTRDMLLKLEDRMFLNPASRIKSIPKTPLDENKDEDPMAALLGNSRRW